ncbi:hypothetical protein KC19_10G140300 [Ceratodon purpureus]|uniref:Uncharacterized protein n=1 Tax=Ceratodon purpureus TaxID=3225 RepID=A0A8T0GLR4_CERPU|nr:hypothetical protein KC19_10G140300 [Ceratodon purpureus]
MSSIFMLCTGIVCLLCNLHDSLLKEIRVVKTPCSCEIRDKSFFEETNLRLCWD